MKNSESALVLDFGGVVTRTLFETHRSTEEALGLKPDSLTWLGPFEPGNDPLWVDMQAGKISERAYWDIRTQEVSQLAQRNWQHMSDFVQAARGADPVNVIRPEALKAIESAKSRGCRLAILSNELDLFYGAEFRHRLPFLSDFDVVVDATYTNILKPDPRAYLQCCNELSLEPQQCVFVDDQQKNVTGASDIGMHAVKFDVRNPADSFEQALQLLEELQQ